MLLSNHKKFLKFPTVLKYCDVLGVSITSEPQLYVLLTVDTVRMGNSFITILITRSYNYLQLFLTLFKRLHNYNTHKLVYVSN
jgi:hypothetical protein